jgi:sec-independent protein translocase protein TatB
MEILGIGGPELIFILVIALIVIGPRDLGKTGRSIGRFLNKLYRSESWRTLNEASRTLRTLPNRLAREAALDELDQVRKDMSKAGQDLAEPTREIQKGLDAWTIGPVADPPPPDKPTTPDEVESEDEAEP